MTWLVRLITTLIALTPFAVEARTEMVSYSCNVEGQPAKMIAQLEYIGRSGITTNPAAISRA